MTELQTMAPASIILIDDHAIFRFGLSTALSSSMPETKIFEADSISSAMLCAENNMDLVLLDIKLPGLNGLEGITLLKRKFSEAPIVIMSSQDDSETMLLANSRGAAGFISKVEPIENALEKIHLILQGIHSGSAATQDSDIQSLLTPRQCEVLNLLHKGFSDKTIAHQLSLSESTVHLHVRNILGFFNSKSRAEAVFTARSQGLIS
jgi:DNA-binding NarL/FixJ family response regulator